jgi:hypothetical protein
LAVALLVAALAWAAPASAADVSGTVDDLTGSFEGRVYLKVMWSGGGETSFGTSIDQGETSDFTIRGVPAGDFVVAAFLDVADLGIPLATSPVGMSEPFQVAQANVEGVTLALDYPGEISGPGVIEGVDAIQANGLVLLFWDVPRDDQSGFYLADYFTVCWDTDPAFTNESCYEDDLEPTSDEMELVVDDVSSGETGTPYYFRITPELNGTQGEPAFAEAFVDLPATGATVSGTVTFAGFTPAPGTPVYVAAVNDEAQQFAIGRFDVPEGGELSFDLTGVADGDYSVYVIADLNFNNRFDIGDVSLVDSDAPLISVQGADVTDLALTLNGASAVVDVATEHYKWLGQGDYYNVDLEIEAGTMRPVAATLLEGPDGPLDPVDVGLSSWGGFNLWLSTDTDRPQVDDTYTFEVTFDDGSVETIQGKVSGVLDSFATPVSPKGLSLDATEPTFTWQAPQNPPAPFYSYDFQLWGEATNYMNIINEWDLSSDTTSIDYDLEEPLVLDTPYYWSVTVRDRFDNRARIVSTFTPVTQLPSQLPNQIGVFRTGKWYLDADGNNSWNAGDIFIPAFGLAGDKPVTGDWNSDGTYEIGLFRNGKWYLDSDGSNGWNAGDTYIAAFGLAGDEPVTGDWNGDGITDIGVFRNGKWYLDSDGNRAWNAGDTFIPAFGLTGDKPVTGDWNGDGITDIGVFRNGKWYLDSDGNRVWNAGDTFIPAFGLSGDLPFAFRTGGNPE